MTEPAFAHRALRAALEAYHDATGDTVVCLTSHPSARNSVTYEYGAVSTWMKATQAESYLSDLVMDGHVEGATTVDTIIGHTEDEWCDLPCRPLDDRDKCEAD